MANRLPTGAVLIIVPKDSPKQKAALLQVAKYLTQKGHHVQLILDLHRVGGRSISL